MKNEIVKFSILDEKTKFAILDEMWTKSGQLIARNVKSYNMTFFTGKKCHWTESMDA